MCRIAICRESGDVGGRRGGGAIVRAPAKTARRMLETAKPLMRWLAESFHPHTLAMCTPLISSCWRASQQTARLRLLMIAITKAGYERILGGRIRTGASSIEIYKGPSGVLVREGGRGSVHIDHSTLQRSPFVG